jgi:hypothetical protein
MRPYKALFGGATNDPSVQRSLDFTVSAAEGYDDNVLAEDGGLGVGAEHQLSGLFTSIVPGLTYSWSGKSVEFSASGSASFRYYQKEHESLGRTAFGAVGLSAGSDRTRLSLNQSVNYSPAYFYGLFPSLASPDVVDAVTTVGAGSDFAADSNSVLLYETSGDLNRGLTSRSSLDLSGTFRYSDMSDVGSQDLRSFSVGGRYLYNVSRNSTLHLGYFYREGQYSYIATSQSIVAHDIDIGIDYHRPLSFSRRTHFDFSVGSSVVNVPSIDSTGQDLQYRVVGSAGLTHDMGRTWKARVAYDRNVGFVEGLRDPVFADALNASVDGFVNRRVDLHVGSALSMGESGTASTAQSNVRTYMASARVRSALTENLALFAEYIYYNYNLGTAVITTPGVPRALDRNTARVGVTAWLPLLGK